MSDFLPARDFGLGPGIARELGGEADPIVERIRFDIHPPLGEHLNVENIVQLPNGRSIVLDNTHIPLDGE